MYGGSGGGDVGKLVVGQGCVKEIFGIFFGDEGGGDVVCDEFWMVYYC